MKFSVDFLITSSKVQNVSSDRLPKEENEFVVKIQESFNSYLASKKIDISGEVELDYRQDIANVLFYKIPPEYHDDFEFIVTQLAMEYRKSINPRSR